MPQRAGKRPGPSAELWNIFYITLSMRFLPDYLATRLSNYLQASYTAIVHATVVPTIGLLPIPIKPIISTCAGTEEEPGTVHRHA